MDLPEMATLSFAHCELVTSDCSLFWAKTSLLILYFQLDATVGRACCKIVKSAVS